MFVCGSLSYDRFWDRLPAESTDPTRRWPPTPPRKDGVRVPMDSLILEGIASPTGGFLERGIRAMTASRIYVVARTAGRSSRESQAPHHQPSAIDLEKQTAATNARATGSCCHCQYTTLDPLGPSLWPSLQAQSADQDAVRRYVSTAFAYGCGLGPTEAARHLESRCPPINWPLSIDATWTLRILRAASADLINCIRKTRAAAPMG
jgi:hypothetical protein